MPHFCGGLLEQDPNAAPVCVHDPEAAAVVAPAVEIRDLSTVGGERRVVQHTGAGKEEAGPASARIDGVHAPVKPGRTDDLRSVG